jgi:hypothetical protein
MLQSAPHPVAQGPAAVLPNSVSHPQHSALELIRPRSDLPPPRGLLLRQRERGEDSDQPGAQDG